MKHVVPSETVAHLWANKAQDSARNDGRNTFYFSGDTIFSYGSHFPIARHVVNSKGISAIFFTTRSYSVTTSGHKNMVRGSIPGNIQVFEVLDVNSSPRKSQLDEYQENINGTISKAEKATVHKALYLGYIKPEENKFQEFAKWLGSKRRPKLPSAKWYQEQAEKVKAYDAKQKWKEDHPTEALIKRDAARAKREELAERKRLQEKAEQAEQFQAWLAGANVSFPSRYSEYGRDYLRVFNGQVETSRHAYVPLDHVQNVRALILRMIEEGKVYRRNGHTIHLGHYAIESLDASGNLTVGCHKFSKEEILRFVATLPETFSSPLMRSFE